MRKLRLGTFQRCDKLLARRVAGEERACKPACQSASSRCSAASVRFREPESPRIAATTGTVRTLGR